MDDTNSEKLVITARRPIQRPRDDAGTNSVKVAYPTTISAPRPMPMMKRRPIRTIMLGAKAAAIDARPKIARFTG